MALSSTLFNYYLKCHLKCWLSSRDEPIKENRYASWLEGENDRYRVLQSENIWLHANAAKDSWQLNSRFCKIQTPANAELNSISGCHWA